MRLPAIVLAALAVMGGAAHAQSSVNILTTGSKSARSAMTGEASLTQSNGVRLYKGSPRKEEPALLGGEPAKDCNVEIEIRDRPWRSFRRLRTQGFYSGVPYPSRQYTQGFYSGRR
ncbi:hypothetical protein [Hyphococcus sp.]|jgi:hypothetical protein|uniref:hypothetical protein n=1 Tax=Hyphococcus sp. TaxID=2038636 RepID=UPI003D0C2A33